ncbi:MAG: hypothetical protein M3R51_07105 [Candidatus Eremiobacteraeota bacterium]|nr:hypothetical protein [Candidatus Eremiobacteraeota bacterium]
MRTAAAAIVFALCGCAPQPKGESEASSQYGPVTRSRANAVVTHADFGDLTWREIGPAVMGGRLDAVAGVPGDANTIYLGHSSGGLYKSTDAAMTFAPIFHSGRSSSIGAIAVAPSDQKTIYAGTGEGFPRNTAALGDGVFVSADAGKTWRAAGLTATQHIARIAVDPHDPKTALAAAMGPEFSAGGERGIYRTSDAGKHWTRTLWVNATTGGADVTFDPNDSSVCYAGTFDYLREPWTFRGGGTGSGLFKSADGGRSWKRLTDSKLHNGLPGGIINRVGVSISAHHSGTVYAIVPTGRGMLYRSDDAGSRWTLVNAKEDLVFRPFYFSQVRADPDDPKTVWIVSGALKRSTDGGKTFKSVDAGGDNHDLWIDPQHRNIVLLGSDIGFDRSVDGGETWDYVNAIPFGQVYRVGFDRAIPYHVMGGMQDHEVWWGPNSLWNSSGVDGGSWRNISDWGDGQYAQADPRDPDIIYEDTHFGDVTQRNLLTGEARVISPVPAIGFGRAASASRYRFNWSAPLLVSPHDSGRLYFGGDVLFTSTDAGTSWTAMSPDLTQPCNAAWLRSSGGPISVDDTNAETYCTIFTIAEDASGPKTVWAGTDTGNVELTRDGGTTWTNVASNIPGLPAGALVACIDASQRAAGTAYVTFDRHRRGDTHAYAYRTTDYGSHWTNISGTLPQWAYVIREDPRQPDLLFAGSEEGLWASFDRGAHWMSLQLGSDHVPVYDLKIQPDFNDLIVGTHGRGFAIVDDITPLEGLARAVRSDVAIFAPGNAWRYAARPEHDLGQNEFVAENKPYGALITYYLAPHRHPKASKAKRKKETIALDVLDATGALVRHLDATAKAGINRVVWDLQTDPPDGTKAAQDARPYYIFYPLHIDGPEVMPGRYTVRIRARGQTLTVPLIVRLDPSVAVSDRDLQAQHDALLHLATLQEDGESWLARISKIEKGHRHRPQLDGFGNELRNGDGSENAGYKHPARVLDQIAYLRHIIATSFSAPTQAQAALIDRYDADITALRGRARTLFDKAARNAKRRESRSVR